MSLVSNVGHYLSQHLLVPFVDKPGLDLPKNTARKAYTVEETVAGRRTVDHFVQSGAQTPTNTATRAALDMTPVVPGGFKEGDIVLRGNSMITTAESGLFTSITEWMRTGKWETHKSAVSHSGIVVRDPKSGALKVVQMVSSQPPAELADKFTWLQKKLKATYLREDSLTDFFNLPGTPITKATVMRPKDQAMARKAAAKALDYYTSQADGKDTHPWYAKLPHSLSPGGRGGVCSTFVDLAYEHHFKQAWHMPTTPEHFVIAPDMVKVGDKTVTDLSAAPAIASKRLA